jgi:hypothetical protein
MSISDTTEVALLALIFNATAWANYADNAASVPQTQIAVGLHTADPADAGTMATSESAYTNYARQNVNRNTGGWTVTANGSGSSSTVAPVAAISFPASGAAGTTITNFSTGKTGGGAAAILFSGTVTPNIAIGASGVTPQLTTSTLITLD